MPSEALANCIGEVRRWKGSASKAPIIKRPCVCGCDFREGVKGVGYIIGSDEKGNGFTIWIKDERLYKIIEKSFRSAKKN